MIANVYYKPDRQIQTDRWMDGWAGGRAARWMDDR